MIFIVLRGVWRFGFAVTISHRTERGRKPPRQRRVRLSEQHHNVGVRGKFGLHTARQREHVTSDDCFHVRAGQSDDEMLSVRVIQGDSGNGHGLRLEAKWIAPALQKRLS